MNGQAPNATASSDIAAELVGVCKTFRQRQRSEKVGDLLRNLFRPTTREIRALRDVSLSIRRGEIVAYAGPNGAGKSTTVKILAGLLAPDAGTVRVLGMEPVRERARYVSRIGVVFGQRTELWWDQPVAASFEWKRVVWEVPDERYYRMLGVLKELLDLGEFYNALARELSLGQKMRADLALALLHEPEILFLDEPTIGVDVLAKRHILDFLRELNRTRNVTVMVTSHDMSELEQLAGRIVLIHHGRIAFDGDFSRLRREFGDRRHLLLHTENGRAPVLTDAEYVGSDPSIDSGHRSGWHEYRFDAGKANLTAILEQASSQGRILDVETHRAPIDDVIADIYERWRS